MKAILFSLGTRGDIEPFLAIARNLRKNDWEVICSFPEQFRVLVEDFDLPFTPLSKKFIEILESDAGKLALGGKGSVFKKIKALLWMMRASRSVNREIIKQQHDLIYQEHPDRVIYSLKCTYPVLWGMAHPGKSFLVSPTPCLIHPVKDHPVIGFKGNFGPALNQLTYRLHNFGLVKNIYDSVKSYASGYPGTRFKPASIKKSLLKEKTLYTISPSIFPRPDYWPDQAIITGYHSIDTSRTWSPDFSLQNFIQTHHKILFISFGSMTNPEPEKITRTILAVLTKNKIPAIINTASGGLSEPDQSPDHIFFIEKIPYEWILPRIYATMHHGGSGTTHSALKYGCPTLIIPHILDQHFWNERVVRLKVGPKGISIGKMRVDNLESRLLDLWNNEIYKRNARRIAERMAKENHPQDLSRLFIQ